MTKNEILEYVMTTPENVNRQVLGCMLDEFEGEGAEGGSFPFPTYECNLISDIDSTLAVTPFSNTSELFCLDITGGYYAIIDFSYQPTKGFLITPTAIGEINDVSDSEDKVLIYYQLWAKQK